MDEKIIISSTYNKRTFRFISLFNVFWMIGAFVSFIIALLKCDNDQYTCVTMWKLGYYNTPKPSLIEYGEFWLAILFVILVIVGIVVKKLAKKCTITVAEDRIYGITAFRKQVDLPMDSISAISKSAFNGIAVATSSGSIKFIAIKNHKEIYDCILGLLKMRQNKATTIPNVKQEIPQSNADELKKFKELLDSGVITQEEFDAKKKQLLGL